MAGQQPVRVGAVSYLNTKPLVYRFAEFAPQAELVFDLPSRLADRLADGELDAALIPSIEFFQQPTYTIVSDACIGCRGPVLSVKLLSRVPWAEVRSIAMDEGSRTSVALARILLRERFEIEPELSPLPLGAAPEATKTDAVLVIGDRAIAPPAPRWIASWDLGQEWVEWSGLPFVFAMWVARAGSDLQGIAHALEAARDSGVAHIDEIAAREGASLGLSRESCLHYLRDNLHFYLGEGERRGLALFHKLAAEMGYAPNSVEIDFDDCTTH